MNLSKANEFGLLETRNQKKHTFLLTDLEMILKTNEVVAVGKQILLPELHNGERLAISARIAKTNRLHRTVTQRVAPATRKLLDGQAALEVHRLFELVKRNRFGAEQRLVEPAVLLYIERTVQIVVAAFIVASRAKRDIAVDGFRIDHR